MKDIREDLRERIASEERERIPHEDAIQRIAQNIATLTRMLEIEERRYRTDSPQDQKKREPSGTLQDFLLGSVIDQVPKGLDQIRAEVLAAGFFRDGGEGQSPGRVIHAALLNPLKSGKIMKTSGGRYYLAVPKEPLIPAHRARLPVVMDNE